MGSDAFSTPSPIQLLDTYRNLPQTKAVNFEMQVTKGTLNPIIFSIIIFEVSPGLSQKDNYLLNLDDNPPKR